MKKECEIVTIKGWSRGSGNKAKVFYMANKKQKIEYRVCVEFSVVELQSVINAKLSKGWKLSGGVAISKEPHYNTRFCQAIYRKVKA